MTEAVEAEEQAEALEARGRPVHTRSLELELFAAEGGRLRTKSTVIDLRKFGFVPTGGDLQTAGVIHQMSLATEIDAATRVLLAVEPAQAVVAFEASARTGGESCRDTIDRLRTLAGARLDDAFAKRLGETYGGALGCSHLLTLAHLLAATLPRALAWEELVQARRPGPREPGERLFKRTLVIDGFERDAERKMDVAVQLNDVASAPLARAVGPLDRFGRQHEVQLLATVELATLCFASLRAQERVRAAPPLRAGGWQPRDSLLAPFVGGPALQGLWRLVRERLGDDPEHAALRDVLANFAPGLIQCMAAFAGRIVEGDASPGEGPAILQLGGLPDSCYFWRAGGPGSRMRWTSPGGGPAGAAKREK